MSGVRVGSRLEQLEQLRRQINQEIALERRKQLLSPGGRRVRATSGPATRRPGLARTDTALSDRLDALGVTTRHVKAWAVEQGLLTAIARGPVAAHIVDEYEHAHPTTKETR